MEKAEYIDRTAIREKVCTGCTMWVDGVCRDADPCENLIAGFLEAPAADVAPVRHGRWEVYLGGKELMCSSCKATFWDEEQNGGSNYCPNCGAKMDLEVMQ